LARDAYSLRAPLCRAASSRVSLSPWCLLATSSCSLPWSRAQLFCRPRPASHPRRSQLSLSPSPCHGRRSLIGVCSSSDLLPTAPELHGCCVLQPTRPAESLSIPTASSHGAPARGVPIFFSCRRRSARSLVFLRALHSASAYSNAAHGASASRGRAL
jgi:hypothetical protein